MSTTQSNQINLRVSNEVVSDLDALAEQGRASRIDLARQILLEGIARRKRDLALRLYGEGKVSSIFVSPTKSCQTYTPWPSRGGHRE